ncbi:MAG: RDD family protein [Pseudomonadota bacterium]
MRMGMVALDLVLLMILFSPLTSWLNQMMINHQITNEIASSGYAPSEMVAELVSSAQAINILYYNLTIAAIFTGVCLYSWHRFNTSPSKWLFGYKIVMHSTYDKPPLKNLIIRAFACVLLTPICCINFLWCLLNKEHRTWHDVLAGTSVVKAHRVNK